MPDERKLCTQCIADGQLKQWLEEDGTEGRCDFDPDHDSFRCVTVDEFAEEADRWFRDNYQPGADTMEADPDPDRDGVIYGTEGEPYEDIFAYELGASNEVLKAVIEALPDVSHHEIAQGAEPFYTDATKLK